jgi:hypothetical protein
LGKREGFRDKVQKEEPGLEGDPEEQIREDSDKRPDVLQSKPKGMDV